MAHLKPLSNKRIFPGQTDGRIWIKRDGGAIGITEMDDQHLENSIKMLERGIETRQKSLKLLKIEQARRDQIKHEEWQKARRMSSLAVDKPRLIRDE